MLIYQQEKWNINIKKNAEDVNIAENQKHAAKRRDYTRTDDITPFNFTRFFDARLFSQTQVSIAKMDIGRFMKHSLLIL